MEEEELLLPQPGVLINMDHIVFFPCLVTNLIGFALRHRLSGRLSSHAEK